MLSSVAAGFKASRSAACIVIPVDVPCFQRESCERLLALGFENPGAIVRPLYRSRGGHPLIVPSAIGAFLDQGGTLREALTRSGIRQVTCELNDPGVVFNINSPEDLRRAENELPGV
jgi:CTP:molybdopterin cytidylyltransferase MocA